MGPGSYNFVFEMYIQMDWGAENTASVWRNTGDCVFTGNR